jgi:hypothetical protein
VEVVVKLLVELLPFLPLLVELDYVVEQVD